MCHATANDLLENFSDVINNVDGGNRMIQVSMDGLLTNWKFFNSLQKARVKKERHNLIDIGSCSLYIIHGAFKTGAESSGWNMKVILKGAFTILHDTPARREDNISVTGEERFPLFLCATRWVEDTVVANRLIEIWDSIIKIVRYWKKLPKSKQPASKNFLKVQEAVNDKFAVSKFQFFSFVGSLFQSFLTKYEISWPMLPYLYDELKELVRNVLQLYVKYEVIEKCKTASDYKQISLSEKSNIVSKLKLNTRRAADITIAKMKHQDIASKSEIATYKQECLSFLLSTTKKLFEKTPLGSSVVHYASCLIPSHVTNLASSSESFKQLMNQLVYLKILPGKTRDKALIRFSNFNLSCVKEEPEKITSFDPKKQRIDGFYFHSLTNISEHNELCDVLKLTFTISHGQANVERGFFLSKNLLNQNVEAVIITSRRNVNNHLISNKIVCHEFKIPAYPPHCCSMPSQLDRSMKFI